MPITNNSGVAGTGIMTNVDNRIDKLSIGRIVDKAIDNGHAVGGTLFGAVPVAAGIAGAAGYAAYDAVAGQGGIADTIRELPKRFEGNTSTMDNVWDGWGAAVDIAADVMVAGALGVLAYQAVDGLGDHIRAKADASN